MENVIEIKDLCFSYGTTNVLTNVNMSIKKGEIAGIIGANGAGKTTFIRLLVGSLRANSGNIKVYGADPIAVCKSHSIGYVSQAQDKNKQTFPATVLEVVMMNLYSEMGFMKFYKEEHKKRAIGALELVGMQDYKDRLISALSGGQRQRVMIAKSIVSSPHILILDEPTTGVDEESSKLIYSLIQDLNKKFALTIIIISHDIKNLKKYSTSLYEIEYGKINKYNEDIL